MATAALERVKQALSSGDVSTAHEALRAARSIASTTDPPAIPADDLDRTRVMIETMPDAALRVLRASPSDPYSVLGVGRLAEARELNTVNRRMLLKKYRGLALTLHPDRCDHEMAIFAMQALNDAYDRVIGKAATARAAPRPRSGPSARPGRASARW